MKKQIMILTIILVLFSSSVSAGFWDWVTGRAVGNETNTTIPKTFYVDVSDAFELRIGDTAIYRAPNGLKRRVTLNRIEGDMAFVTHTTVEGYKDQVAISLVETFLLDGGFNLNTLGQVSDISILMVFERIPKEDLPPLGPECNTVRRGPLWHRYWENLGLATDKHPALKYYRIQWFSGGWSRWYTAGVDDLDWKRNFGGGKRRVWSYFRDHTHEFVNCPVVEVPTPEPINETPINETPVNETPEPEEPINETPINETPVNETPEPEEPIPEEPINETPINETPEPEEPIPELPEEPVNETPINETPEPEEPIPELPEEPLNETPEPEPEAPEEEEEAAEEEAEAAEEEAEAAEEEATEAEAAETIAKPSVPIKIERLCEDGCLNENGFCIPVGIRFNNQYCNLLKEFTDQKNERELCDNNFECSSNLCIDSECISSSVWKRFLTWFTRFF